MTTLDLIVGIAALIWVAIFLIVLAVCWMAAKGDRVAEPYRPPAPVIPLDLHSARRRRRRSA